MLDLNSLDTVNKQGQGKGEVLAARSMSVRTEKAPKVSRSVKHSLMDLLMASALRSILE